LDYETDVDEKEVLLTLSFSFLCEIQAFKCDSSHLKKYLRFWSKIPKIDENAPKKAQFTYEKVSTSESIIRDKGKGVGWIVFFSHNTNTPVYVVQITSDQPEPGMNAFSWELFTQVIAIQITQYQSHNLPGFSDCTTAITRTNLALRSYISPVTNSCGWLWASAPHMYTQIVTSLGVLPTSRRTPSETRSVKIIQPLKT
jgi:hypothetical protein